MSVSNDDEPGDASRDRRNGENLAPCARLIVVADGDDDDVSGLRHGDRLVDHQIVADMTRDRERRSADGKARAGLRAYLPGRSEPITEPGLSWLRPPRTLFDHECQMIDAAGRMDPAQPELWDTYRLTEVYRVASWNVDPTERNRLTATRLPSSITVDGFRTGSVNPNAHQMGKEIEP